MKKLMIAACAVALATAAQATTYNWQYATTAAINDVGGEKATQTLYLMMGYADTTAINNAKKALLVALRAGTYTEANITTFDHYSGQSKALVNGVVESTSFTEEKGGKQYAFGVIFDTDSTGAKYAYITGNGYDTGVDSESTGSGVLNLTTANSNIYAIDDTTKTGLQQGWYTIQAGGSPVPEPTSGLLLLLGVAGLSLRRKQK